MYNDTMKKVIVHKLRMGDVEDPELFAAEPIYKWQQTEHGKWVMDHSLDSVFHTAPNPDYFGYQIVITATFTDQDYMMYRLKWE